MTPPLSRGPKQPSSPGRGQGVEHEYERMGAVCYLDAWDVRRGTIMGRTEPKGGIAAFDRLVRQVMIKEPYRSARRVFWVVDNGSDHRGQASIDRLQSRWRNLILVHLPIHASWLNQVEIYHSIIQRKVLDPNDFTDTAEVARTLNQFERRYNQIAKPFDWNFTRQDLAEVWAWGMPSGDGSRACRHPSAASADPRWPSPPVIHAFARPAAAFGTSESD